MITGEFSSERSFARSLDAVWRGFADPDVRRRWRSVPGPRSSYVAEVRTGGRELIRGVVGSSGTDERITSTGHFLDVVDRRRIVMAYAVTVDDVLRWSALVTLGLVGDATSSTVRHDEQFRFHAYRGDGVRDAAHLRGGVNLQWNRLEAVLDEDA